MKDIKYFIIRESITIKNDQTNNKKVKTIKKYLKENGGKFDFTLLGMGRDGHTASIFPEASSVGETGALVLSVEMSPSEPLVPRITLTSDALSMSSMICFVVVGEEKIKVVEEIVSSRDLVRNKYPAAMIGDDSDVRWFITY